MRQIYILILLLLSTSSFSQTSIKREEAIKDIDFFNQTLEEVHYNPYLFIDRKNYDNKIKNYKESLKDTVSVQQFLLDLYQLTSSFKDSHTSPALVQPVIKHELSSKKFFPLVLVRNNNKLYAPKSTATQTNIPKEAEILSINDNKVADLLKMFDNCFSGQKEYAKEMTLRLFPYLAMLSDIKPPYIIKYKEKSGRKGISEINNGINFKDALTLSIPSLKSPYDFRIIDNKLGLFRFLSMSGSLDIFDRYVDSCITAMKQTNIKHLAIDIRDNSGGNSIFADLMISYFYSNDYTMMSKKKWKISQQYKNYLIASNDTTSEYLTKTNGSVWELGSCEPQKPRFGNNNVFNGKVFIITGPFTFSSANMFADGAKEFKMAELIGTPTGENTIDFGEVYKFELPNSKIKMQVTTSFDFGADCKKKSYSPVSPNKKLIMPLKYKIEEKDYVLEQILKNII